MNRPECYRDKDKWRETCRRQKERYYRRSQKRKHSGAPWSRTDIETLLDMTLTDTEIAERLGRSVRAVQGKRYVIKRSYTTEGIEWPYGKGTKKGERK